MMDVRHDAQSEAWDLAWQEVLLRIRLADGTLIGEYFGPARSAVPVDLPEPYREDALWTFAEASVRLAPDDRLARWSLRSWSQSEPTTLALSLQAMDLPLKAELRFLVDDETGLLHRRSLLHHTGDGPALHISHAGSMAVLLPPDVREVVHLAGRWGAETQVQRMLLPQSPLLLENRAGRTGFEFAPYVALRAPGWTYVGELMWSGNWQLSVRRLPDGRVAVSGGLNSWGFHHHLRPGESLVLPGALLACVPGDLSAATRRLHDYRRRHLRPDNNRPIPVQFNSWYPYQGEPPVEKMKEFASTAAELGCEVFVLDAGWYTTETEDPDEWWWSRTGDWVVNRRLFPDGLEDLSTYCRARGLGFGIWFEPEAVSPNAVIRRTHPEWLHTIEGQPTPPDQRAILHLGVPEARAFVRERILSILQATGAVWMKWDFNANLHQGGWDPRLPEDLTSRDPLIAHYEGVYRLQDELRMAVPELTLEMCSSGGGRFDPEILSHAHTNWMSDQTQPLMNLAIHFGSQLAHCAVECNDWLIEWPPHDGLHRQQEVDQRGDLAFRTRIAMLGTFGISAPVGQWTSDDVSAVKDHVSWYKETVRPLVNAGDQYMLTEAPPLDGEGDWAAVWYAAKDARRGVLFAFRLASSQAQRSFALPGLVPEARYRLRTPEGWSTVRGGAELADGLVVTAEAPFRSVLIAIEGV
jgi:alpha-galactosidase